MSTASDLPISSRLRIMIVEDEPDIATLITQMLNPFYDVVHANNGLEALDRLNWYEPDLTIMDLMMPILDGFDTTRAIKKDTEFSSMPVMFLTARKDNRAVREALMAGGDVYLEKPFDPPELLARIQDMITRNNLTPRPKRYTLEKIHRHFNADDITLIDPQPEDPNRVMPLTEQLARAAAEPRARVLAIMASDQQLDSLKQALKKRYEIILCNDAELALDKISAYEPDVLIITVNMPTMNGFHLAQLTRINKQLKAPWLIFAGNPGKADQQKEAMRLNASLLQEEFEMDQMSDALSQITGDDRFQRRRKRLDYREILHREEPDDENG